MLTTNPKVFKAEVSTGLMPFPSPDKQHHSTEGNLQHLRHTGKMLLEIQCY